MKYVTDGKGLAVGLAALAAVSCAKVLGGGTAPVADENGSVAIASPSAGASALAPSTVANVGTHRTARPVGTNPDRLPAPVSPAESQVTLPSPAVMQSVAATQSKLEAITAVLEGTRVRYVDCAETAACTARLEAQSLAGLRDLLRSVSAQQGGVGFVAREQLDGFAGRTFVADVTLGGTETRPVPVDENELLAN